MEFANYLDNLTELSLFLKKSQSDFLLRLIASISPRQLVRVVVEVKIASRFLPLDSSRSVAAGELVHFVLGNHVVVADD